MEMIALVVLGLIALGGIVFVIDFFLWESRGIKTFALIEGFEQKPPGALLAMPVLSFELEDGAKVKAVALNIDQMLYMAGQPEAGTIVSISYRPDPDGKPLVRVRGYMRAAVGFLMILPFFGVLASYLGQSQAAMQAMFGLVFIVILGGGLVALRLIQKSY